MEEFCGVRLVRLFRQGADFLNVALQICFIAKGFDDFTFFIDVKNEMYEIRT